MLAFEASNLRDAAHGLVTKFHHYFGVEWQVNVNSRTEFDESHVLLNAHFFAGFNISNYATCYGSSNLAHQHIMT